MMMILLVRMRLLKREEKRRSWTYKCVKTDFDRKREERKRL